MVTGSVHLINAPAMLLRRCVKKSAIRSDEHDGSDARKRI